MWIKLRQIWEAVRKGRARSLEQQTRHRITMAGQKWLGPGESLRILDVESDGGSVTLALWTSKTSSHLIELSKSAAMSASSSVRGAVA